MIFYAREGKMLKRPSTLVTRDERSWSPRLGDPRVQNDFAMRTGRDRPSALHEGGTVLIKVYWCLNKPTANVEMQRKRMELNGFCYTASAREPNPQEPP